VFREGWAVKLEVVSGRPWSTQLRSQNGSEHQVCVGVGVVAVDVVGVPLGVGVRAVVVAVVGRVVGNFVGASVGETVLGRAVGSFVGSRGDGVLVLVSITGVPPDGTFVTGGGGRSHM